MGGFLSSLGSGAAQGFEQARQIDLQRQFADEQARRGVLVNFLGHLAQDETVHPDVRNAAGQAVIGVAQTPLGKAIKWNSVVDPVFQAATAVHPRPSQQMTPPPLPPMQLGNTTLPAQQQAPVVNQPPSPPQGIYMSPQDVTAMSAQRAGAVSGGQLSGQIAARQEALKQIPDLPPELQAGFAMGVPMYGAMTHTLTSGTLTAGEARAQGIPVDQAIPDDQMINAKKTLGGWQVAPTDQVPAGRVSTENGIVSKQEAQIAQEQRQQQIWSQRNRTQFQQALVKQDRALQNSLTRGDYTSAKKVVTQARGDYDAAVDRMQTMDKNAVAAKNGNQQAMLSLVANHIGMTLGAQKGARITRAVWDEAMQSAPVLQRIGAKFDKDGILMGVTLSPQQVDQMTELAHEKLGILHQHMQRVHDTYTQELNARPNVNQPPAPEGKESKDFFSKFGGQAR